MTPTNDDRAAWAQEAISAFQKAVRTDDQDALKDLLCDLMHWAPRHGDDFDACLRAARSCFEEEVIEEAIFNGEDEDATRARLFPATAKQTPA